MIPSDQPEIRTEPVPGMVFRRYRLADGSTVETYELPATVVRGIGLPRLHSLVDAWIRGVARRAESAAPQVGSSPRAPSPTPCSFDNARSSQTNI